MARCVHLPDKARLLERPEGDNVARAINDAMKAIQDENPDLPLDGTAERMTARLRRGPTRLPWWRPSFPQSFPLLLTIRVKR